jgi:hypothetical protein
MKRPPSPGRAARALGTLVTALGLSACARTPLPTAELARAEGSVRAAEAVGAREHAASSMYLERARGHLERAQEAMAAGDATEAEWALERAEVDAELALALTQREADEQAARDAEAKLGSLKSELERP